MCLTITGISRPARPQICYKIIKKISRTSPYYPTAYPVGKTVKAGGEIVVLNHRGEFTDSLAEYNRIYGGVIHVYTDRHFANCDVGYLNAYQAATDGDNYCVIKVRCLPKHFVATGDFHDAVYTQVEVLD